MFVCLFVFLRTNPKCTEIRQNSVIGEKRKKTFWTSNKIKVTSLNECIYIYDCVCAYTIIIFIAFLRFFLKIFLFFPFFFFFFFLSISDLGYGFITSVIYAECKLRLRSTEVKEVLFFIDFFWKKKRFLIFYYYYFLNVS